MESETADRPDLSGTWLYLGSATHQVEKVNLMHTVFGP